MKISSLYTILIQIGLANKKRLFVFHVFTILLLYFLANPYVTNTGDFTQNTKYLMLIGIFFYSWQGYKLTIEVCNQIDFNYIIESRKKEGNLSEEIMKICLHMFVLFTSFQLAIMFIFYIYYCFLFSASMTMLLFITKLYIIYYVLPFIMFFLMGSLGAVLQYRRNSLIKTISYLFFIIAIVIIFIIFEMVNPGLDIFIVNSRPYYNPLIGIENIYLSLAIKGSLMLTIVFLFIFFYLNMKGKTLITIGIITAQVLLLNQTYLYTKETNLNEYYLEDYMERYNQHIEEVYSSDSGYSVLERSVDVSEKEGIQFLVTYTIDDLDKDYINIFLNLEFEIVKILNGEKELDFSRIGRKIEVNLTEKTQIISVIYRSTNGTSLNPVNKDYAILPYFYQWLPSAVDTQDYTINSNEDVVLKNKYQECKQSEWFVNKWPEKVEGTDCISILNGEFSELVSHKIKYYIPTAFVGGLGELKLLEQELVLLQKEVCLIFDQPELDTFCHTELSDVAIVPKYEVNAEMTYEDIWFTNGTYFILVNPYLDVNGRTLVEHVSSLAIFNIPQHYLTAGEMENSDKNELAFLFAMYYIEKYQLDVKENIGLEYLSSFVQVSEYEDYSRSSVQEKKEYLISKYKEYSM